MVVSLLRWSSGSRQSRLLCLDMLGSRCLFAIQVEVYLDSWTLSLEFRSSWGVGTGASPRRLPVSPRQADSTRGSLEAWEEGEFAAEQQVPRTEGTGRP